MEKFTNENNENKNLAKRGHSTGWEIEDLFLFLPVIPPAVLADRIDRVKEAPLDNVDYFYEKINEMFNNRFLPNTPAKRYAQRLSDAMRAGWEKEETRKAFMLYAESDVGQEEYTAYHAACHRTSEIYKSLGLGEGWR